MAYELKPLRLKDRVLFHCDCCGGCCKRVEKSIMLEPLDIYRLARHFREQGEEILGTEDVLSAYAEPIMLTESVPIFTLKVNGTEQACVFLKENRCSVYAVRPRVCRLYPYAVRPGIRGKEFDYFLALDKEHHFRNSTVLTKDWFYENFSKEDRAFVKADYEAADCYGKLIRRRGNDWFKGELFQFLYYRYYHYDLNEPFLPQFRANHEALLNHWKERE